MATRRLFDEDPVLCDFTAPVEAVRDACWVALQATAFFPEDGGQRSDRGTLDGIEVVSLASEGMTIWHQLAHPIDWETGRIVVGRVDADRRRDHRQQHSGQHLLSRVFHARFDAPTRGFHMGEEVSTVDIDRDPVSAKEVRAVEVEVNRVVMENRPVATIVQPREGELPLRIVDIGGYDGQPCCGTHVSRTGEIGIVKVLRWERMKGLTRVEFVCGERALRLCQEILEAVDRTARVLSAGWLEVPGLVERTLEENRLQDRALREWRKRWATLEAERIARETPRRADGVLFVAAWIDGAEIETLRAAANAILAQGHAIVVLAGPGDGAKSAWVAGRSEELPAPRDAVDARTLLASILEPLGGKGGGSRVFAQGSSAVHPSECVDAIARAGARI